MSEGVNCRRVSKVVGGNVHGLNGSNGAVASVANAFFQVGELGAEGQLVTQSRWELTTESRNLRTGLNESKDVVN